MFKAVLKKCIPLSLRIRIREQFRVSLLEEEYLARKQIHEKLPRTPLSEKHVQNCTTVLNRATLLTKLPKGGNCAELGVNRGEFSEQILATVAPAKLHLVDVWDSEYYHDGLFQEVSKKFSAAIEQGQVEIHRKLSTEAVEDFTDQYFDWIYIDTDHSYKNTKAELHKYAPKLKPAGLICGHDYVKGSWVSTRRYGVIEAVHEFCVAEDWEIFYLTIDATENTSFAIRKIQPEERTD